MVLRSPYSPDDVQRSICCKYTRFPATNDRWEQLVIPANASALTVRDMFADDLPVVDYDSSWVVFGFDGQNGQYVNPGIDGSLPQGAGFWMIQNTGNSVTLDLPDSIGLAISAQSSACTESSCTEASVFSTAVQSSFNMIGSALTTTSSLEQTRLRTPGTALLCQSGCTVSDAVTYQYLRAKLWRYDSTREEYIDLADIGQIAPWQALWVQTAPALSGVAATMLFPTQQTGADPGDSAAARLLAQATFGPSLDSIDAVRQLGIEGWIDNQFTLRGVSHLGYLETNVQNGSTITGLRQQKWLLDAIDAADQLRLRVAFAYSEIFGTSDLPNNLDRTHYGMANYYDILRDNAFANYRDLLEHVTLSPIMGI